MIDSTRIVARASSVWGASLSMRSKMTAQCSSGFLFVGYQAAGNPWQAIQSYGPAGGYVDPEGE